MSDNPQLRRLTTLRIGGTPARYFRPATEAELAHALAQCRGRMPWRVLGGGSNVLADDGDLPFAVIHVHAPGFGGIQRFGGSRVRAGAGVPTARLLSFCTEQGLGGLEFLSGLPGTVGGALAGNAGAWGRGICDLAAWLRVVRPDGRSETMRGERLGAGYRRTELGEAVITRAEFALRPTSPELVARRMAEYARRRGERQPLGFASAGCVFRNPPGSAAGRLLDLCGLKGASVGDAEVSRRHANFVLNAGSAGAGDVLELVRLMTQEVRRRFDIELELEVRHWPALSRVA